MFEHISVLGRIVYCICCLEQFVREQGWKWVEWEVLWDNVWSFAYREHLDNYDYLLIECQPDGILESDEYVDYNYISEEEFRLLRKLYRTCPRLDIVGAILNGAEAMLGVHVYESITPPAQISLDLMERKIYPCLQAAIQHLPPVKAFEIYSFHDNSGWGIFHPREAIYASIRKYEEEERPHED